MKIDMPFCKSKYSVGAILVGWWTEHQEIVSLAFDSVEENLICFFAALITMNC